MAASVTGLGCIGYGVEITELCVGRVLTDEERAQAEHRAQAFIRPHVDDIRAALRGR